MDSAIKSNINRVKDYSISMNNQRFIGEAGTGFIKVTLDGKGVIVKIDYEKNDFITKDLEVFVDLIRLAYKDAHDKMIELQTKEISALIDNFV